MVPTGPRTYRGQFGSWVLFRNGLLAVCEHTRTIAHRDTCRGQKGCGSNRLLQKQSKSKLLGWGIEKLAHGEVLGFRCRNLGVVVVLPMRRPGARLFSM